MSFGLSQSGGDGSNNDRIGGGGHNGGLSDGTEMFGVGGGGMGNSSNLENDNNSNNSMDPSTPWTAIAEGNLMLLQQSLQQLSYPIYVADDNQGYTLLQAAASYNQMHILQYVWSELQQQQQAQLRHAVSDNENDDMTSSTNTRPFPEGGYQNATDHDGDTALHYAGSVHAMTFLIDTCHIDIHIQNHNHLTALESKRSEMKEIEQDVDDFDEDDMEYKQIKEMVQYLESITMNPQQC